MNAQTFRLTPLDTLFFRDSRPFDQGPLQSDAESLFPPPARTIVGSLRLALAQGQGFRGPGSWSGALAKVLGDGPEDLGKLRFGGPYLTLEGEPLYPMPLHILGKREGDAFTPAARLAPGAPVRCDLGTVRLPAPIALPGADRSTLGSGAGFFLRRSGLEAALSGRPVDTSAVVSPSRLYVGEARIGLEREAATRTAKQGQLYAATHLRLRRGVSLAIEVMGLPEGWAAACQRLVPLGGEGRMAELELGPALAPIKAARSPSGRVTVTLLTPVRFDGEATRPGRPLPGLPGARIVSACLGKPISMGGWDTQRRQPLPLVPYLPAGSTWFCEIDAGQDGAVWERHGGRLGPEAALGFGAIALGTWDESTNEGKES